MSVKNYLRLLFLVFVTTITQLCAQSADKQGVIDSLRTELQQSQADSSRVLSLNKLAMLLYKSKPDTALVLCKQALALAQKSKYINGLARSYKSIGICYYVKGEYEYSISNYLQAITNYEVLHDTASLASLNNNIGIIYWRLSDRPRAVAYYNVAMRQFKSQHKPDSYSAALLNVGALYNEMEKYDSAIYFFNTSKEIKKQYNDTIGIAYCNHNIAYAYRKTNKTDEAIAAYKEALIVYQKAKDDYAGIDAIAGIGEVYFDQKKYAQSKLYFLQADSMARAMRAIEQEKMTAFNLYRTFHALHQYREALDFHVKFTLLQDSILNKEKAEIITEMQTKYETDKKEKENELLRANELRQNVKLQLQRTLVFSAFGALLSVLVVVWVLFRANAQKKRVNTILAEQNREIQTQKEEIQQQHDTLQLLNADLQQKTEEIEAQRDNLVMLNEELEAKNEYVVKQRDTIMAQNKAITDSIQYAKRIQTAMLPSNRHISKTFDQYFVLWRPRDIVSGDFYWFTQMQGKVVFAIADCTGHGVPGAFMSMLGVAFLNEIVQKRNILRPASILNELRTMVKDALHQSGRDSEQKDGMDIALCVYDPKKAQLQYAGAHNPLFIIRQTSLQLEADIDEESTNSPKDRATVQKFEHEVAPRQLYHIRPDAMPIGIHLKEYPFRNVTLNICTGDTIYLFSDGYADQTGGTDDRKFMTANFKRLLLINSHLPLSDQKTILENTLNQWQQPSPKLHYEQIDDILVAGFRV